jgi:hypothetical protein
MYCNSHSECELHRSGTVTELAGPVLLVLPMEITVKASALSAPFLLQDNVVDNL